MCTMSDPRVAALSGLVADGDRWYAVNAGGDKATVMVLRKDCTVERQIVGDTDPFDVQDLGRAPDGTFLLADGGDRRLVRTTAALIALTPAGKSTLYRLSYPDGKHQASALLVGSNGTPYFVTKSAVGDSAVYAPVSRLESPGPTPMKKLATVKLSPTDTPGGPPPARTGSMTITGGAVNADGTVVALRTYTDAYLYPAPDKDIVKALAGEPVRVPLPDEALGEAVAFDSDGSLLSAPGRTGQPIRSVTGAADLAASNTPPAQNSQGNTATQKAPESAQPRPATSFGSGQDGPQGIPIVPVFAVGILLVFAVLGFLRWRTTRSRRRFYRPGR
jgi:hypothetical protein